MSDIQFPEGLIVKPPHEKAPDFVKAKLSIKRAELMAWLKSRSGDWVNLDIKVARSGKWYAAVDDWKPKEGRGEQSSAPPPAQSDDGFEDDSIPF